MKKSESHVQRQGQDLNLEIRSSGMTTNVKNIRGRRREDDEVSLLASNEGIPDPPQAEQDLSQVCFNPVANVTLKWSPHEVIASCVSKYFGSKDAMSAQILEDHGAPYINSVVVPQIDQTILMAPKVQRAENV